MIILLKKIILFISVLSFVISPLNNVNSEKNNENEQILIEQRHKQSIQIDKLKNAFLTEINNELYFFPKNLNIVTLGDSITEGVGDESKNAGYVGLIEDFLDHEVIVDNRGIAGYRSDQLLELIDEPDVEKSLSESDLVLMTIGANDLMKVFKRDLTNLKIEPFFDELNEFEERLNKIFTKIHQINPQANIYLIGFYDPFSEFFPEVEELSDISSSWNAGSAMITKKHDYTYYIPTSDLFEKGIAQYLAADNFHPNKKGYTKIASEIIEHIKTGVEDAYETN